MAKKTTAKTIGIDHGNANIKTRDVVFKTGLARYAAPPIDTEDYIKYGDSYYVLTNKTVPYVLDKTQNDDYFILTLFAIVKQAPKSKINLNGKDINLGVGLPPQHYQQLRPGFINYFKSNTKNGFNFDYGKTKYSFYLKDVLAFPQAYAAIYTNEEALKLAEEYGTVYIIDIGGGTADFLQLTDGVVDIENKLSLERGVNKMFDHITNLVLNQTAKNINADHITRMLSGKKTVFDRNEVIMNIVKNETKNWVYTLLNEIRQASVDLANNPVIFIGGGSIILQPYLMESKAICEINMFIENISANALGYEILLEAYLDD